MAYSANWITKVVTVPVSDLILVSGTRYQLSMIAFLIEIRRLESEFTEGLWADQIIDHSNTRVDFAGVDYAPFDEIINGYTIEIGVGPTRVDLIGSNNNLIDVLIPTGVAVVPSNSAGLISVTSGSGVTAQDKIDIINGTWLKALEGTITAEEMMKIMLSALAGVAVDADTAIIKFRDQADTKDRIVADIDGAGNRTSVTVDGG